MAVDKTLIAKNTSAIEKITVIRLESIWESTHSVTVLVNILLYTIGPSKELSAANQPAICAAILERKPK